MIISKENRLNNDVTDSWCRLKDLLTIGRGTSDARSEMKTLRERSLVDAECQYCGAKIGATYRSLRRSEACVDCACRIDRMLVMKSKLLRAAAPIKPDKAFETFVSDYESLRYVPQTLGGADKAGQIIATCKEFAAAQNALRIYRHEMTKKQNAENIRQERLSKLRNEYSRYRGQMSEEEFNEVIESQYVQRYHQDIM